MTVWPAAGCIALVVSVTAGASGPLTATQFVDQSERTFESRALYYRNIDRLSRMVRYRDVRLFAHGTFWYPLGDEPVSVRTSDGPRAADAEAGEVAAAWVWDRAPWGPGAVMLFGVAGGNTVTMDDQEWIYSNVLGGLWLQADRLRIVVAGLTEERPAFAGRGRDGEADAGDADANPEDSGEEEEETAPESEPETIEREFQFYEVSVEPFRLAVFYDGEAERIAQWDLSVRRSRVEELVREIAGGLLYLPAGQALWPYVDAGRELLEPRVLVSGALTAGVDLRGDAQLVRDPAVSLGVSRAGMTEEERLIGFDYEAQASLTYDVAGGTVRPGARARFSLPRLFWNTRIHLGLSINDPGRAGALWTENLPVADIGFDTILLGRP